ncbi:MAG: DUF1289 domain-containing protein [Telmatospirillum sp.]|nr:DUF1289 domain-containing protein [Telmatospirillum sp.]
MAAEKSPCVGLCKIDDASGYCRGCGRTIAEITAWKTATDPEKDAILARLPARMASFGPLASE